MTTSVEVVNVDEYEALAKQRMPKMAFDYFANGSEDQVSLRENRAAFTRIRYSFIQASTVYFL
jgi:(S)-2-hydroxy-acid oxidase